jgi:hypothetical protein
MFKHYIELRDALTKAHKENARMMGERHQRELAMAADRHTSARELLDKVTEDYIRRGYLYLDKNNYNGLNLGGHNTQSAYVRKLAKDMKRHFIFVSEYNHQAKIIVPKRVKLAPIVAPLLLLAKPNSYGTNLAVSLSDYRSVWMFNMFGEYDRNCYANSTQHPAYKYWLNELDTNTEWRALIGIK